MKKCKKILALVLAGVLAIGMLAGCGSAASSGTNDNITPDKGVVTTTVNKSLKNLKVDFKSDSTFASQLAIVANSATQEDVKGLNGGCLSDRQRTGCPGLRHQGHLDGLCTQPGRHLCLRHLV